MVVGNVDKQLEAFGGKDLQPQRFWKVCPHEAKCSHACRNAWEIKNYHGNADHLVVFHIGI